MDYNHNDDLNFDLNENQPSHLSYKQYQKKVTPKKKNENLVMFISAFFVMLLVFLGLAKQLSPDIDVSIGNENPDSITEGIVKGNGIDNRLQNLKNEDKGSTDDEMFDKSQDEKVVVPDSNKTTNQDDTLNNGNAMTNQTTQVAKPPQPQPVKAPIANNVTSSSRHLARVVVGYYATAEQAEVAKGILQEAGLGVSPVIKNIGGAYTLQTGSYSSREYAQAAASTLIKNNFPARVIVE